MKKYDLHTHTKHSPCSNLKAEILLRIAKKKGLDGIAVTDHDTIKGGLDVFKLNKDRDFEVIVGSEIKTKKAEVTKSNIGSPGKLWRPLGSPR